MAVFTYRARDGMGRAVNGSMEAANKSELVDKLRKMGYMPTKVAEARPVAGFASILDRFKSIKSEDLLMFYIQFSNMISAGLTILMSLSTLSRQVENKALRDALGQVSRRIEGGSTLSEALASQQIGRAHV